MFPFTMSYKHTETYFLNMQIYSQHTKWSFSPWQAHIMAYSRGLIRFLILIKLQLNMNKELMWSESVQQVTYEMVASEKKKEAGSSNGMCSHFEGSLRGNPTMDNWTTNPEIPSV